MWRHFMDDVIYQRHTVWHSWSATYVCGCCVCVIQSVQIGTIHVVSSSQTEVRHNCQFIDQMYGQQLDGTYVDISGFVWHSDVWVCDLWLELIEVAHTLNCFVLIYLPDFINWDSKFWRRFRTRRPFNPVTDVFSWLWRGMLRVNLFFHRRGQFSTVVFTRRMNILIIH